MHEAKTPLVLILLIVSTCLLSCACNKPDQIETTIEPAEKTEIVSSPIDSRWELASSLTQNPAFPWKSTGKCFATLGEGRSKSFFTAVSENASELTYSIAGNGPEVAGMVQDDYLLFCVPMAKLEAGTDVDFFVTLDATNEQSPRDWIFEYLDNGEWKAVGETFRVLTSAENHTSVARSFTSSVDIVQDTLKMRCRVVSDMDGAGNKLSTKSGGIYFVPVDFQSCRILSYPKDRFPVAKDSKRVLALGNSFSYYCAPVWMLKEIARSQGHQMELRLNLKGAQTFANHLKLSLSQDAMNYGGFDYAFIQDQSTQHSKYAQSSSANKSVLDNTIALKSRILEKSPDCTVVLESTWAYSASDYTGFGSYEAFDKALVEGTDMIAKAAGCTVSPIGTGFAKARACDIPLYHSDDKHQAEYGAYIKACINYLIIYGEKFSGSVSDCNLAPKVAAELRAIAEEIVIK